MNAYYNIQTRRTFVPLHLPFLQGRRESGIARNRQNATVEDLRQMSAIPPVPLFIPSTAPLSFSS